MKKLIMAAAIVCSAVAVQAASVAWTSNNKQFCDSTGTPTTTMTGGQLVLVTLGSTLNWDNATVIETGSGNNQTTIALNTGTGTKTGRVTGLVTFDYTSGGSSNFIENGDYLALMWKDGTSGDLSKLVYADGGAEAEAYYQVSGLSNNATMLTGKAIAFTGNFQGASVPEPTSGLLLLLGVAGIALKRRRA